MDSNLAGEDGAHKKDQIKDAIENNAPIKNKIPGEDSQKAAEFIDGEQLDEERKDKDSISREKAQLPDVNPSKIKIQKKDMFGKVII